MKLGTFLYWGVLRISSPKRSSRRAVALPHVQNVEVFMFKVFYVMGKALKSELSCLGTSLVWVIVGQGPTVLAAGGGYLNVSVLFFFLLFSGRWPEKD